MDTSRFMPSMGVTDIRIAFVYHKRAQIGVVLDMGESLLIFFVLNLHSVTIARIMRAK